MNDLVTNIEKYRIEAELTKQELADRIGIVVDHLYNAEILTIRNVMTIAKILGVKAWMLMPDDNEQLLDSMPTADVLKALVKREGVNYVSMKKDNIHCLMINDCFVGIGAGLREFDCAVKGSACNE